jgi:hypothetical protein
MIILPINPEITNLTSYQQRPEHPPMERQSGAASFRAAIAGVIQRAAY